MRTFVKRALSALVIAVGMVASMVPIAEAATSTLSGTVVNESGDPIAGATVDVIDATSGTTVASTTSDGAGQYSVGVAVEPCLVGVVTNGVCVISDPLIELPGTCPEGGDIEAGCYRLVNPVDQPMVCAAPYYSFYGHHCQYDHGPFTSAADCPFAAGEVPEVSGRVIDENGSAHYLLCTYTPLPRGPQCPLGTYSDSGVMCRMPVPPISGGYGCPDSHQRIGDACTIAVGLEESLFDVRVTPPAGSGYEPAMVEDLNLSLDIVLETELTSSPSPAPKQSEAPEPTANPLRLVAPETVFNPLATWIMDLQPVIEGVVANGTLSCSTTTPGTGSSQLAISIPGASAIWLSKHIDATVVVTGPQPNGSATTVFTGPIPASGQIAVDMSSLAAGAGGGLYDVSIVAYTITGFRQEMTCPTGLDFG